MRNLFPSTWIDLAADDRQDPRALHALVPISDPSTRPIEPLTARLPTRRRVARRRLDKIASSMPHLGTSLPRPIERGKGQSGNSPTDSAHETFDDLTLTPTRVGGVPTALDHPGVRGVVRDVPARSGTFRDVPASMPGHEPGFVPPHIYASTYSHRPGNPGSMDAHDDPQRGFGYGGDGTGSMIDGRGHTLKGRAALKARNAFMRRTGFLEPDTPSALSQQPPDRIATPAIVVDANGAE